MKSVSRNRLMKNKPYFVYAMMLFMVAGCLNKADTPDVQPVVPDKPTQLFGLDETIPGTISIPEDAIQLAAVADEYARQIKLDGEQDEPYITTTKIVEERVSELSKYAFGGKALATPAFVKAITDVLAKELENNQDEGQELTPELRNKAISIFKAIAWSLKYGKTT